MFHFAPLNSSDRPMEICRMKGSRDADDSNFFFFWTYGIISSLPIWHKHSWGRPFHFFFEKVVFDSWHGDRLSFVDCLPSPWKDWVRTTKGAQRMSLRGDAIRQVGAKKVVRPSTRLGMRRPFKGERRPRKKELCYWPTLFIALGSDLYDLLAVQSQPL